MKFFGQESSKEKRKSCTYLPCESRRLGDDCSLGLLSSWRSLTRWSLPLNLRQPFSSLVTPDDFVLLFHHPSGPMQQKKRSIQDDANRSSARCQSLEVQYIRSLYKKRRVTRVSLLCQGTGLPPLVKCLTSCPCQPSASSTRARSFPAAQFSAQQRATKWWEQGAHPVCVPCTHRQPPSTTATYRSRYLGLLNLGLGYLDTQKPT